MNEYYFSNLQKSIWNVIPSFFRQPKRYSLQNALVPAAIELHETMKENSTTALTSLISQCVTTLEQHTQQAPTWSLQATFKCRCEFCTKLAAFLKEPQKLVTHFSTKQSNRSHLEGQLWNNSAVSCTTERRASPHTLVVTKTDGRFKMHRARLELLERIRPLLGQEKPQVKRPKLDDVSCIVIDWTHLYCNHVGNLSFESHRCFLTHCILMLITLILIDLYTHAHYSYPHWLLICCMLFLFHTHSFLFCSTVLFVRIIPLVANA